MIWTMTQVAIGGALGAVARHGTQLAAMRTFGPGFPTGTLIVNVAGSFAMGLAFVWLAERGLMRHVPLLMIGFLGAYTTFSTFSMDALALWERGEARLAAGYVLASVLLSLAGVVAGVALGRGMLT